MSNNSIAKTHIRYMVGGRADAGNEVLYRFEFPERPGALLDFLKKIGSQSFYDQDILNILYLKRSKGNIDRLYCRFHFGKISIFHSRVMGKKVFTNIV
jgi:hypothetical protein